MAQAPSIEVREGWLWPGTEQLTAVAAVIFKLQRVWSLVMKRGYHSGRAQGG